MPASVAFQLDRLEVMTWDKIMVRVTADLSRGRILGTFQIPLPDMLVVSLDLIAVFAVLAFATLCLALSRGLHGSALRRGFTFAGIAGAIHVVGNLLQVAGDFGFVASEVPPVVFSAIQAVFFVMMALAVRSFFPAWYKNFKKSGSQAFGAGSSSQSAVQR